MIVSPRASKPDSSRNFQSTVKLPTKTLHLDRCTENKKGLHCPKQLLGWTTRSWPLLVTSSCRFWRVFYKGSAPLVLLVMDGYRGATSSDRVAKYRQKMLLAEEKKGRPCHPTSGAKKGVK
ncbi:hypothetical protein JTE90_009656 [Oedothorax gibbosus]|uniref:Uncharacterized protein n=1 Tax=Oedothorax gibbosus TaxID=931172 RepID=A0AAV6TV52_9ARAC|nr:hypothetical protein JTE90_009656 [Oedothorax gibbosus]